MQLMLDQECFKEYSGNSLFLLPSQDPLWLQIDRNIIESLCDQSVSQKTFITQVFFLIVTVSVITPS